MSIDSSFLDTIALAATLCPGPRVMLCPRPGDRSGMTPFNSFAEWRQFVLRFALSAFIPRVVTDKFERAQKQYIVGWLDLDLVLAAELVALTALDLALRDRYGHMVRDARGNIYFSRLVEYMVEEDGLTDDQIPMSREYSVPVVANLYETRAARKARESTLVVPPMTLVEARNSQMHGYPDSLPRGGLLELVRDLIGYAYRDFIAEARAASGLENS